MTKLHQILKPVVAALLLVGWLAGPVLGQAGNLDELFTELAQPDNPDWQRVEDDIWAAWSRSGSDAMDLLLERGRAAIEEGNLDAAIEHLTALVDHAPEFAEGWNARATAYFNAGLYGPSLADIERTLALNPRHFGALAGLGLILEDLGLRDRALEAYKRARAIHPHRPDILEAIERLEKEQTGTKL